MHDLEQALARIEQVFSSAFGVTSLQQRIQDLLSQSLAVSRFRDEQHLQREVGDLLCSVLQLCNEHGWRPEQLIGQTLEKIEHRMEVYRQLGRKLRVGLIAADFDPIHNGHLSLARAALQQFVDEVWLMPRFDSMDGPMLAPIGERIKMCELAIDGLQGCKVFDYEVKHQFRGETYHLMKRLLGEVAFQNRVEFNMLISQDAANELLSLPNGAAFERLLPFVVVARPGQPPESRAWYLKPPHQFLDCSAQHLSIDSADVRRWLQQNPTGGEELLPGNVLQHIRSCGLYTPHQHVASSRKIALYSDSFNPPTLAHREHIQALLDRGYSRVVVHPCWLAHSDEVQDYSSPRDRAALLSLAFNDMPQVIVDYDDISLGTHRSLFDLQQRYESEGQVWIVAGYPSTRSTSGGLPAFIDASPSGERLWKTARFAMLDDGAASEQTQLPPNHVCIPVPAYKSCEQVRSMVYHAESIDHLLERKVADYVRRHRLYIPGAHQSSTVLHLQDPRLLIVYDERNPKAVSIAQKYMHLQSSDPNLILVIGGDGTMLRAIREKWRERLPFVGLNSGHLGFLMNERLPDELGGLQLISQTLPLLRVDSKTMDGQSAMNLAYGDTWLERAEGQAAWIRVDINGETMLDKVVGDGMLVATASGSSAYARAMGSMPVPIDSPVLTLAGSNIFQPRFWRPMNLPINSQITLTNVDAVNKRPLRAFVDGNPLGLVREISIRASLTAG